MDRVGENSYQLMAMSCEFWRDIQSLSLETRGS